MITPLHALPPLEKADFFRLKIYCAWECYPDDIPLWTQNDRTLLCMSDGDLLLDGCDDADELLSFIRFTKPRRIFASRGVLQQLNLPVTEELCVLSRKAEKTDSTFISYEQSSKEIYELLSVEGLSLPEYEQFAPDFCRRLNHGWLHYFAIPQKCAALTQHSGNFAFICGIASHEKGYGTVALNGILRKNYGRTVFSCCRADVHGFYEKNGFSLTGTAGYWENEDGLF